MAHASKRRLLLVLASVAVLTLVTAALLRRFPAARAVILVKTAALDGPGEFRHVRFSGSAGSFDALCTVFKPDAIGVRIVDAGSDRHMALGNMLAEERALVVVNGGYFDAHFRPFGLLRIGGEELSAFVARPPFSGCVLIDEAGGASLVEAGDPAIATAPSAMQAGPFLVDPGGRLGIRSDEGKLAERTVVATDGGRLCLAVTTPVTLRELAECLVDHPAAFGLRRTDRALNLDGGPSTGCAVRTRGDLVVREPRGRVRTMLIVETRDRASVSTPPAQAPPCE